MRNYVRMQSRLEERLFRFKNEPEAQPQPQSRSERTEERRVRVEKCFNTRMADELVKAGLR